MFFLIEVDRSKTCCDHILLFISRFIEKYGTHIIVGVKMGGKDIIYVKQQHSSLLQPVDLQKKLKDMADKLFVDRTGKSVVNFDKFYDREKVWKISMFFLLNFMNEIHVRWKAFHLFNDNYVSEEMQVMWDEKRFVYLTTIMFQRKCKNILRICFSYTLNFVTFLFQFVNEQGLAFVDQFPSSSYSHTEVYFLEIYNILLAAWQCVNVIYFHFHLNHYSSCSGLSL